MKMKKLLVAVVVLLTLVISLVACAPPKPGDSTILYDPADMEIVKGLDAHDAMLQAFDYYKKSTKYSMTIDFVFDTNVNAFAYQSSFQHIKRNGKLYYDLYMVQGKGGGKAGDAHKYYIDFNDSNNINTKAIYIEDNGDRVYLDDNNKVKTNFDGLNYGDFNAKYESEGIKTPMDRVNKMKDTLSSYLWEDEKYLADEMDRNVYKDGDKYYCTTIINTMNMTDDNYQDAVVKAIEKATGGEYKEFNANTRMVAQLEKVGDTFRFVQYILMEDYTGKKGIDLKVSQSYWHKFAYDDYSTNIVMPK